MRIPRTLGLERLSGLYLWGLFIVVFSIWSPSLFPTASTVHTIASGQAVSAMLTIAVLIPLIGGSYDLSVAATANLTAVVAVDLQTSAHWAVLPSILAALLCGVLIGLINAFIVVRLRVNSFIGTLGMGSIIAAVQTMVSGNNEPLPPTSATWSNITQHTIGGFQIAVLYLLVLVVVAWWALERTPSGRYLYAIGDNTEAARLSGIRVDKWVALSFVASGTIAGLGGVIYASLEGPSLTFGASLLLPAYAAAFLGSTQFRPGRFNVWGSLLAIYVLATGVQGFEYVTSAQWLGDMFNGVALIAAVAFATWRQRSSGSRKSRKTAPPLAGESSVSGQAGATTSLAPDSAAQP